MSSKEPVGLLDTDPFDPAVIEAHEEELKKDEAGSVDTARQMIERRRVAYARWMTGKAEPGDMDIVLLDLAWFCKMYVPPYDIKDGIHADTLCKMKEGRREVFQRILDFSRLNTDTLLAKYTDAITPK